MKEITVFSKDEFGEVRSVIINDEPWFIGKDVAKALKYSNPQKAIRDHVDEDDKGMNESFTPPRVERKKPLSLTNLVFILLFFGLEKKKQKHLRGG